MSSFPVLDPVTLSVRVGNRTELLTASEWRMMVLLTSMAGQWVSIESLAAAISGDPSATQTVRNHIHRLRTKIGHNGIITAGMGGGPLGTYMIPAQKDN